MLPSLLSSSPALESYWHFYRTWEKCSGSGFLAPVEPWKIPALGHQKEGEVWMVTLNRSCAHFHYRQVSLGNRDDKLTVVLVHMSVVMQNYRTVHECCNLCRANSARVNTCSWHWSQSINWEEGRLIKDHLNATNRGAVINFVCWCSSAQREAFGDLQRHWSYNTSLVTFSKTACFLMQAKCLWLPSPWSSKPNG